MRTKTVAYCLLILALSLLTACLPTGTIGGSITGLTGAGLELQNNDGDNLTVAAGSTQFTFATPIASGSVYAVTILNQPQNQICTVSKGMGTVANTSATVTDINVNAVVITCSDLAVSTQSFPIDLAISNLVKNGFDAASKITGTYTPAGQSTSYPITGQETYSWVPAVTATALGLQLLDAPSVTIGSMTRNGNITPIASIAHHFYRGDNYYPVVNIDDGNHLYVVTSFSGWPTAAKVGDSGSLGAVTVYSDYTLVSIIGNVQLSYNIESETADTVIFVSTSAETDIDGSQIAQSDRYRITATGDITLVSSTVEKSSAAGTDSTTLTPISVQTPGKIPAPTAWAPPGGA